MCTLRQTALCLCSLHTFSNLMGFIQDTNLAPVCWMAIIQSLPGPPVEDMQSTLIQGEDCEH